MGLARAGIEEDTMVILTAAVLWGGSQPDRPTRLVLQGREDSSLANFSSFTI